MIRFQIALKLLTAVVVAVSTVSIGWAQKEIAPDTVMVTVNGEPITHKQVEGEIASLSGTGYRPSADEVFSQLIARELLYQAAVKQGLVASDEEVEEQVQTVLNLPNVGNLETMKKQLAERGNTIEDFKKDLKRQLSINKVIAWKTEGETEIPDASVEAYYNDNPGMFEFVHARHILKNAPESASEEKKAQAKKEIEAVAKRIADGEDFAVVASKESDDSGSAPDGGDLGTFNRGEMVPAFEEAAFSLEPGQISGIVETRYGYHLIKVEEKKTLEFDKAKDQIRDALERAKKDRLVDQWVVELEKDADIKFNEDIGGSSEAPEK
ncbi:MAG: peptidylprolyl isomerase [Candidatus Omnitrophica bacterium]|nr:peptidylprolyl isomerase [Candidatus Omnitrophota bacterium]